MKEWADRERELNPPNIFFISVLFSYYELVVIYLKATKNREIKKISVQWIGTGFHKELQSDLFFF